MNKIFTASCIVLLLVGLLAGCTDRDGIRGGNGNLDLTPPVVILNTPENDAVGVPINRKPTATFSEAMNQLSITTATFYVTGPSATPISGEVAYTGTTATFTPTSPADLAPNTEYTVTITTGASDLAGNALASNYVWSFTTGDVIDENPPTVILNTPEDDAVEVPLNSKPTATFVEAMDPLTITTTTFTLSGPGTTPVSGTVAYAGMTATFTPTSPADLIPETEYTATITTGASDLAGNTLATDYVWTFTTGELIHLGPDPVILGTAGEFNILAGSAVNNTDTFSARTMINGLVGVFPGSAVTGLPTEAVPAGQIHAGDVIADAAKAALLVAYNDAASRSLDAISLPGNMGGLTLAPGLYVNSTSSGISGTGANAILTLDAQGDENAVWIFKMGSTLITDPGTSIVLAGNAQASNIFWQVGSSATLGTNSSFKGNILADISITLTTGANLEGRALTRVGAVTLDTNTITLP